MNKQIANTAILQKKCNYITTQYKKTGMENISLF
jgi:hypothetical protein